MLTDFTLSMALQNRRPILKVKAQVHKLLPFTSTYSTDLSQAASVPGVLIGAPPTEPERSGHILLLRERPLQRRHSHRHRTHPNPHPQPAQHAPSSATAASALARCTHHQLRAQVNSCEQRVPLDEIVCQAQLAAVHHLRGTLRN